MGYVGVPPQSGFITTAKQRVTSSSRNGSGASYIYMAFAEAPLVGTNGVTAKAR